MANWQTIEELKDIFIKEYTDSKLGSKLEKACSEEYELARDYNGRQILELLQNVDDAYSETGTDNEDDVSVKIILKDNILEVGNTGTTFSQETIERLCLGRASEKSSKNIGNKGTGFRALLNDAEWVEVHSGDFSIRFSEQYAQEQFEQYVNKFSNKFSSVIYRQLQGWKKEYNLCFPIMNCPEQIARRETGFDTLIRVKLKEENRDKSAGILNQLRQPFYKSLLFLPNITQIEIVIDDVIKTFEKVVVGKQVLLSESQNTLSSYYVEEKKNVLVSGNKAANLIIAVPLEEDYDFLNEKLYCYFPIRNCKTPVNSLIHAPFLTNNSRDDIPNDNEQINKKIFEECLKFLKEVAENIANDKSYANDLAIKTVTPTNTFTGKVWGEDFFNLKSFYLQLLVDTKLLPTVNDTYISLNDNPKCIPYQFPKKFKGDAFEELLKLLPDNVYEFVEQLALTRGYKLEYTEEELAERLNGISSSVTIPEQIEIFLWWSEHYRNSKELPHLLKDTSDKWIERNVKIYLPTDSGVSLLPESLSWVNLCVLAQSYVDELVNQLQSKHRSKWDEAKSKLTADIIGSKRILDKVSDLYFPVQFTEQSNADLIIDEINKQVDTSEKAISFIRWFYVNYKNKIHDSVSRFNLAYKLPDRDGNLKSTRDLFLGKDYGNELAEKIFKFDASKFAVASFSTLFDGFENERDEVLNFLKRCGVNNYPKIYQNNALAYNSAFSNHIKRKYSFEYNINYLSAMYVDGFEQAIDSLDTKEVIQWIIQDIDLYNLILSREKAGYFAYKKNASGYSIYANEYIIFILNTAKWIKIEDGKYSPNDIVKCAKLKNNVAGIYGISESKLIELLGKQIVQEMGLGFVNSLAAFPDSIIRKILLKLPEFDTGEISRSLYEDIIKLKKGIVPTYPYTTNGLKVLASDGNFYDNIAVRYADRKLPKAASESTRLIHLPPKRSTETIKNWLGVERYKMNLEMMDFSEMTHLPGFDNEISDIKIVALAILDEITDSNIQIVKRLKIIPCDYILVKDVEKDDIKFELDDFNYIKKDGKYYIKIPAHIWIEQIRGAFDFRTSITEIFEDGMRRQIDQNHFAYLLLNDTNEKRRIIDSEYGIDKWNSVHELLYKRSIINKNVIEFFKYNALGEQLLDTLKDMDFSEKLSAQEFNVLKRLLIEIGKDIKDLNNFSGELSIDIRPCIKEEFSRYKNKKLDAYRVNCYNYAVANKKAQKTFLEDCNRFRLFELDLRNIENTIRTDYDAILEKEFKEYSPTVECANIDIDATYSKNYEAVISLYLINI